MENIEEILRNFKKAVNSIPKDELIAIFNEVNSIGDGDGITVDDYFNILQHTVSWEVSNNNSSPM
jgi:hypothetical protein